MKKSLLFMLAIILPMVASAIDFEINGIGYNIVSIKDKTAEAIVVDQEEIIIPESVTYSGFVFSIIGVKADLSSISSITLPSSIEYLVSSNHSGRIMTHNVYISDLSKFLMIKKHKDKDGWVQDDGYYGNFNLYLNNELVTSITFPDECDSITDILFNCQNNIENLYIPKGVKKVSNSAFYGCSNLKNVKIDGELIELPSSTFENCTSLENISLPNSIQYIGNSCFYNCSNMANIVLPANLIKVDEGAFGMCKKLSSVIFPQKLVKIGGAGFMGCSSLVEITIPQSVFSIKDNCFKGCTGLKKVTLEGNYLEIGNNAFDGCSAIEQIVSNQNQLSDLNENVFSKLVYVLATLKVPIGLKNDYSNHQGWNLFENIQEDENCLLYTNWNKNLGYKLNSYRKWKLNYSQGFEINATLTNNSPNNIYLRRYDYRFGNTIIGNPDNDSLYICIIPSNSSYEISWTYTDYYFSADLELPKYIFLFYSDDTTNYIYETGALSTDISSVNSERKNAFNKYYSISGTQMKVPLKGRINIIHTSDGEIKKVISK